MQERMALPLWPSRVSAAFFATCGLVAVILVTVGLFGVTYQVVSQRTREFGVRLALGATAQDLRHMVFGESLRLAAPGLVIGLVVAAAAASAAGSMLVGVSALDPRVYLAAITLQLAVTLLASWVPALRASRVSPQTTMRSE
jgi:putative ABC transport system permease protein